MNIQNLLYGQIATHIIFSPFQFLTIFIGAIMSAGGPNCGDFAFIGGLAGGILLSYIAPTFLIACFYGIFLCLGRIITGSFSIRYECQTRQHKLIFVATLLTTIVFLCCCYYYSATSKPISPTSMEFVKRDIWLIAIGLFLGYVFCCFLGSLFSGGSKLYKIAERFSAWFWRYRPPTSCYKNS